MEIVWGHPAHFFLGLLLPFEAGGSTSLSSSGAASALVFTGSLTALEDGGDGGPVGGEVVFPDI